VDDAGFEEHEGDGGDAAAIRLEGAVSPGVFSLEPAVREQVQSRRRTSGKGRSAPHAKHVDEMLLGDVVLAVDVSLQGGEDASSAKESVSTVDFELQERGVRFSCLVRSRKFGVEVRRVRTLWRDGKVLELFTEDDDGLLEEERVLHVRLGDGGGEGEIAAGTIGGTVERVASVGEEVEDKLEALAVKLRAERESQQQEVDAGELTAATMLTQVASTVVNDGPRRTARLT
jgi:hypothetical protein